MNAIFLSNPSDVLQALLKSKEEGIAIGINSSALGPDTTITAVEDIQFNDGQTIIILKHYDSSGYMLPCRKLNVLDIQSVCPFSTPFINPILNNLEKDKSWFF